MQTVPHLEIETEWLFQLSWVNKIPRYAVHRSKDDAKVANITHDASGCMAITLRWWRVKGRDVIGPRRNDVDWNDAGHACVEGGRKEE